MSSEDSIILDSGMINPLIKERYPNSGLGKLQHSIDVSHRSEASIDVSHRREASIDVSHRSEASREFDVPYDIGEIIGKITKIFFFEEDSPLWDILLKKIPTVVAVEKGKEEVLRLVGGFYVVKKKNGNSLHAPFTYGQTLHRQLRRARDGDYKCVFCNVKVGVMKCDKCMRMRYCSPECQESDKVVHQGDCYN
jgi:hypothetical protein